AGMKAALLPVPGGLLAATTAGDLIQITGDRAARPRLLCNLGAEILHAPARDGKTLYVACGNGTVASLTLGGKVNWKCDVGASTYGTPAVDAARVYVADLQG